MRLIQTSISDPEGLLARDTGRRGRDGCRKGNQKETVTEETDKWVQDGLQPLQRESSGGSKNTKSHQIYLQNITLSSFQSILSGRSSSKIPRE